MNDSSLPNCGPPPPIGRWHQPAIVRESEAIERYSLGNWALNFTVGCSYGCPFCYASKASGSLLTSDLANYGVVDPHGSWGEYVFLRQWDISAFYRSLMDAFNSYENPSGDQGNRAILLSSTSDPYQPVPHPDSCVAEILQTARSKMVREALELVRDESDLNVRILTRSTSASRDFDLYQTMGDRLLFGMSIPSLRADLAGFYEPKVSLPQERLKKLHEAREMGISVYVVLGPTYPECDRADLRATMKALKEVNPVTIFHEPINKSPGNVERMTAHRLAHGSNLNLNPFKSRGSWIKYALRSFRMVEEVARELDLWDRLHLWPGETLGSRTAFAQVNDETSHEEWLHHWWSRVSEWPMT